MNNHNDERRLSDWPAVRERLKREHPDLTDDDLAYEVGREEELMERLQKKLNKNREEIRGWLSFMG